MSKETIKSTVSTPADSPPVDVERLKAEFHAPYDPARLVAIKCDLESSGRVQELANNPDRVASLGDTKNLLGDGAQPIVVILAMMAKFHELAAVQEAAEQLPSDEGKPE